MKIAIVTNIPTPYRVPVYSILSKYENVSLIVFFCSKTEPNRNWSEEIIDFNHKYLSSKVDSFVHSNFNIIKEFINYKPDIIITSGFNPTMLFSWLWTIINRKKHIPFSDANIQSEIYLSYLHRIIREIVFKTSSAFIGASEKTLELFRTYNIQGEKLFKSCLAVDNGVFNCKETKKYDIMFCGQFIDRKNPLFFVDLAIKLSKIIKNFKIILVGNGPLKDVCVTKLKETKVDFFDAGFVQHNELAKYYVESKLFIFPTKQDAWGIVANEALASGVPVLVSSFAGVANELVIDGVNGFVFDNFDEANWITKIEKLLCDSYLYYNMSLHAKESVQSYNHFSAAAGIYNAAKYVLK